MKMGMVYCRGCAKEIHETAKACPQCGAPQMTMKGGAGINSNREVSGLLTFMFGFLYFMCKGWFKAGIAALLISIFTGFLAWLIIPFFAKKFVDSIEGTA